MPALAALPPFTAPPMDAVEEVESSASPAPDEPGLGLEETQDEGEAPLGELDVFVQRREDGGWVFTPLSKTVALEVREAAEDLPLADCHGVIWRLDNQVFEGFGGRTAPAKGGDAGLAQGVSRRLKRVATGMRRLRGVATKLQAKLSRFEEQRQELADQRRELEETRASTLRLQSELQERSAWLDQERSRFDTEVSQAAAHLSQALKAPVKVGEAAAQPPDVFFAAAQDEFAHGVPRLGANDEGELRHVRLTPEAAFAAAGESFFKAPGAKSSPQMEPRVDAFIRALLAVACLDPQQAPTRYAKMIEHLAGMAQALTRLANMASRLPLAFAASSCALWCAARLTEPLWQKWDEAQPSEIVRDLESMAVDLGPALRRARSVVQCGASVRRVLRIWSDHADHRRRFIRCLGKRGGCAATEADLRLLLLPPGAAAEELAAHVRRLSPVCDGTAVMGPSRRKRSRLLEGEGT